MNYHDYLLPKTKGLFYFPNFFSKDESRECLEKLSILDYNEFEHEGRVARYEATLELSEHGNLYLDRLINLLKSIAPHEGNNGKDRTLELYAFKYSEGHEVPWHFDKPRHRKILLAYFGDFEGGDYCYRDDSSHIKSISLTPGSSVLISNNYDKCGKHIGLKHMVERIRSGTRYCYSLSMITPHV